MRNNVMVLSAYEKLHFLTSGPVFLLYSISSPISLHVFGYAFDQNRLPNSGSTFTFQISLIYLSGILKAITVNFICWLFWLRVLFCLFWHFSILLKTDCCTFSEQNHWFEMQENADSYACTSWPCISWKMLYVVDFILFCLHGKWNKSDGWSWWASWRDCRLGFHWDGYCSASNIFWLVLQSWVLFNFCFSFLFFSFRLYFLSLSLSLFLGKETIFTRWYVFNIVYVFGTENAVIK